MNKQYNKFSFWKLSQFKPEERKIIFLFGLFKLKEEGPKFNVISSTKVVPIRVIVKPGRNLRRLDDNSETKELKVDCVLSDTSISKKALYNCSNNESNE